jgi:hypothetical protein
MRSLAQAMVARSAMAGEIEMNSLNPLCAASHLERAIIELHYANAEIAFDGAAAEADIKETLKSARSLIEMARALLSNSPVQNQVLSDPVQNAVNG